MRENNHIITHSSYQDISSFKIRQPMNEQSFHVRQNLPQKYGSKDYDHNYKMTSKQKKFNLSSSFYQKLQHYRGYENKEQSRQLSYNSRGSNQTRNSVKMTDYIAQEAKNLINNRDKFKYDGQAHMRSSSVHCYPSSFKLSRQSNEKPFNYLNSKQTSNQPMEIPSFGVQCRTTISAGYNNNATQTKSNSLGKYPKNSFKLSDPSTVSYRIQNRNIKTQIDQRIQRLKASSTSVQHRQRLSRIKRIDQHKLQNMDKINIKIKNILTTLQNQQDHYKKRYAEGSNVRIKKESAALYPTNKSRSIEQEQQQSLLSKYTKKNDNYNQSRFSQFDISHLQGTLSNSNNSNLYYHHHYQQEESQMLKNDHSKTALGKYCQNNASSYYYYEDEQAMIKSSESPFKSSPDRSFKKCSVDRNGARSVSKYSKSSYDVVNTNSINFNESTKLSQHRKEYENPSNFYQSRYPKTSDHVLTNIPECETEIIQSKAIEQRNFSETTDPYHTFETRNSQTRNKCSRAQNTKKQYFQQTNKQRDSQIYHKNRSPQQSQKRDQFYLPSQKNRLNAKEAETQRFMDTMTLKDQLKKESDNQNPKKKSNSIYFKPKDNQKYLQSQNTNTGKSSVIADRNHSFTNDKSELSRLSRKAQERSYGRVFEENFEVNKVHQSSAYISSYNPRNQTHEMTFDHRKKDYIYSDSIKETPIIQETKSNQNLRKFSQSNLEYSKSKKFRTEKDNELDSKFKQYEQKLEKYQKGMSASKILESNRSQIRSINTKRERSQSKLNLQEKYFKEVNNFNGNDNDLQNQVQYSLNNNKSIDKSKVNEIEKYCKLISTPPNYSKRQSHRFPKDDHQKFIENLRRDREQVAQLSQRKSRLNNCVSVENDRFNTSNQRSESQNSKLSSNTIVKGKNIDEEISKIQRKMQEYNQMKKDLNLDSKLNTQRTQNQPTEIKDFEIEREQRKVQTELKDRYSYSESKSRVNTFSSEKKSSDLLKIVAPENTFVKVRKSILKDHKTSQIKNYLDQEIEKQSNRSRSISEKNEALLNKSCNIQSKQNMPPTTTTIDSPKYPNGNKKVVLGLAQNLVLNSVNDQPNDRQDLVSKSEIKTPKLLRNLKNKLNEKCIVKKKAQKRGFRSQFINDLHEDNEILASAKNIQQQNLQEDNEIESTSRYSSQNKEKLMKILDLIEKQIIIDEKFRNEKKMFNAMTKSDKWNILMSEYIRQNPSEKRILLSDIVDIFTLNEEQSNPFYSTRGVDFSLEEMVGTYGQCRKSWNNLLAQISLLSYEQVTSCGINAKNLDIERKGFIEVDDLTRLINMQLNKYYRKRDLRLIWLRVAFVSNPRKQHHQDYKLTFEQFSKGLGLVKLENQC